ncbi:MAG: hypothetical protein HYZ28_15940 [Myxococcales bacterium]|nr:hypothetical protein [Myxococcales bacterium]
MVQRTALAALSPLRTSLMSPLAEAKAESRAQAHRVTDRYLPDEPMERPQHNGGWDADCPFLEELALALMKELIPGVSKLVLSAVDQEVADAYRRCTQRGWSLESQRDYLAAAEQAVQAYELLDPENPRLGQLRRLAADIRRDVDAMERERMPLIAGPCEDIEPATVPGGVEEKRPVQWKPGEPLPRGPFSIAPEVHAQMTMGDYQRLMREMKLRNPLFGIAVSGPAEQQRLQQFYQKHPDDPVFEPLPEELISIYDRYKPGQPIDPQDMARIQEIGQKLVSQRAQSRWTRSPVPVQARPASVPSRTAAPTQSSPSLPPIDPRTRQPRTRYYVDGREVPPPPAPAAPSPTGAAASRAPGKSAPTGGGTSSGYYGQPRPAGVPANFVQVGSGWYHPNHLPSGGRRS